MVKKGTQIRFIGGKYRERKGWINEDKEAGENTVPVIVDLGKKGEKATYVYENSIEKEPTAAPSSYAEAVLQQCPDLDCSLTKLCRDFAKCNIKTDPAGFFAIIERKMKEATTQHEAKGSKALYRAIRYNAPPPSS